MKARTILHLIGVSQGTATEADIQALWDMLPEDEEHFFLEPESNLHMLLGLTPNRDYTFDQAFAAIGCGDWEG